jgi:peptide/nickel transport system substrate-binding protein
VTVREEAPLERFPWERPLTRRRFLEQTAATGAALSAGSLLAACGGGDEEAGTGAQRGRTQKGTLVVAVHSDMQNLDVHTSSADEVTNIVLTNLYDLPITFKKGTAEPIELEGGIQVPVGDPNEFDAMAAESWEWNEDMTEITFTLREGLKFPDGSPLTAEAVKFSQDRLVDVQAVGYFLYSMVGLQEKDQFQVVDDRRIKFLLPKPSSLLFGNMAMFYGSAILNPKELKPNASASDPSGQTWLKTNAAESGPYVLKEWKVGSGWTLEANPNYWNPPKTERVQFQIVPEPQQRQLLLRRGEIDFTSGIPLKDLASLREDPNLSVLSIPSREVVWAGFDVTRKPFDDPRVRQAISYAVPYETILNEVTRGEAPQLKSPIPEGTPTSDSSFWNYDTNPDRARELLAEAGFPDGFRTELAVQIGKPEDEQTAVWIQQGLQEAGIQVQINKMPGAAFTERLQNRQHGFFIHNWISINNDPFYHLFWLFSADCCTYGKYQTSKVMDLVNEWINQPPDAPGREEASREAQRIIVEDAAWVFLYQPPHTYAMRKNVEGFTYYPAEGFVRYFELEKT